MEQSVTSDKIFENSAAYYKNEFLNNCRHRLNILRRLPMKLEVFLNDLDALIKLDNNKDPQEKSYSIDIQIVRDGLKECIKGLENYKGICEEEFSRLKVKDFEKIIEEQKKLILEKIDNEQQN